ncbi:hypothetical protein [Rhizobium sp. EC-SD404]|uniref:hypothetical protein n=1 Tax=Rhizobium sp. EC-SD404 TaxID=2038389 RepID=UPI001251C066|nr:hypothetical protein [Rhizobium sp. EC-SD404]VVT24901.1 conserved hypothetical protein [Rhizobium sp. EC-SD404]
MIQIYPNTHIWPCNALRFHVVFDRTMDTDRALRHVRLERMRSDGNFESVTGALVDLADGLWSPDQTVMTTLFHPARVKTGLAANEQYGRTIEPGARYRIAIDPGLEDANGVPIGHVVEHDFTGSAAHNQGLAHLSTKQNAKAECVVRFDHPLDYLSACTHVRLVDRAGRTIPSVRRVEGSAIRLRPVQPSRVADVEIDPRLEDPCGNRLAGPFESATPAESAFPV